MARKPKSAISDLLDIVERNKTLHLFAMLGVNAGSSDEEIRDKRLSFARVLHPDRTDDPRAASAMAEINRAVSVLLDASLRKKYMAGFRRSSLCPACEGRGFLTKTKGWTKTKADTCLACSGAGYRERAPS